MPEGLPVPDVPYPRVNDTATIQKVAPNKSDTVRILNNLSTPMRIYILIRKCPLKSCKRVHICLAVIMDQIGVKNISAYWSNTYI